MAEQETIEETTAPAGDTTPAPDKADQIGRQLFGDDWDDEPAEAVETQAEGEKAVEDAAKPAGDVTTTPEASEATTLTPEEIAVAKRFQIDPDELKALPVTVAKAAVSRLAKAEGDIGRRYAELGRAKKSTPAAEEQPPESAAGKEGSEDDAGIEKPLSEEAMQNLRDVLGDEAAEAVIQSQKDRIAAREAAKANAEAAKAETARANHAAGQAWFLKSDIEALGTGPLNARTEVQRLACEELWKKARTIYGGHEAAGEPITVEQALDEASRIIYPGERKTAPKTAAEPRPGKGIARPSDTRSEPKKLSPIDAAYQRASDWEKKNGVKFFTDDEG